MQFKGQELGVRMHKARLSTFQLFPQVCMHTIKRFSHGKESKSFHVCFQISLPILFGMGTFLSKESPSTLVTGNVPILHSS